MSNQIKYVIWGIGVRGRACYRVMGTERVIAFIDNDKKKQGSQIFEKPIVSYEEYKKKYVDCLIVVSMMEYRETVHQLEEDGEYRYFILSEAPGECFGWGDQNILRNLPFVINKQLPSMIFGATLFSILLLEELLKRGVREISLVPQDGMALKRKEALKNALPGWYQDAVPRERKMNIFLTVETDRQFGGMGHVIYNAYDFSSQLPCYDNPVIATFKDKYIGKRCFIVATGPSLRMEDLDKLYVNKEYTFSMNKIFYSFEDTLWRPDFYIVEDRLFLEQNEDAVNALEVKNIFVADSYKKDMREGIQRFHLLAKDFCSDEQKFSGNVDCAVHQGGTVTYTCIQFAAYMGFKEIYLLGTDFSYGKMGEQGNHFYKQEDKKNSIFHRETCLKAFETAEQYAGEHGIKIYNATRGGALEVFERVEFDALFEN